jgi:PAS domain-containing protein
MPIFYGLNIKTEWRMILFGLLAVLMVGNVLISVSPLLDSNRKIVIRESGRRAAYMAHELVERNAKVFGDQEFGKADIGFTDRAEGVRLAILTDLDLRVIAPSTRMNQYLTSGAEGAIAVRARELFKQGRETGLVAQADGNTVVAVEPIKVLNARAGKNMAVGLGIVSIDTSIALPEGGEIGMIYSENIVIAGFLTLFVFIVLYRLTLKPFEVLNDDIDKVLKGEMRQVTHEFQIAELDALWDVINSSLQRIQKPSGLSSAGGATGMFSGGLGGGAGIDEWIAGMKVVSQVPGLGVGFLDPDRKILSVNAPFEEITGIRGESQLGVPLPDAARDQSFGLFTQDLLEKARSSGPEGASDEYEIAGNAYRVTVSPLGGNGAALKGFMVVLAKSGAE